jgi:hypothetical protein
MYPECELYFLKSKGESLETNHEKKFLTGNMGEKKLNITVTGPKAVVVKTSNEPKF